MTELLSLKYRAL